MKASVAELQDEIKKLRAALQEAADWMKVVHSTPTTQSYERIVEVIRTGAKAAELAAREALHE